MCAASIEVTGVWGERGEVDLTLVSASDDATIESHPKSAIYLRVDHCVTVLAKQAPDRPMTQQGAQEILNLQHIIKPHHYTLTSLSLL